MGRRVKFLFFWPFYLISFQSKFFPTFFIFSSFYNNPGCATPWVCYSPLRSPSTSSWRLCVRNLCALLVMSLLSRNLRFRSSSSLNNKWRQWAMRWARVRPSFNPDPDFNPDPWSGLKNRKFLASFYFFIFMGRGGEGDRCKICGILTFVAPMLVFYFFLFVFLFEKLLFLNKNCNFRS